MNDKGISVIQNPRMFIEKSRRMRVQVSVCALMALGSLRCTINHLQWISVSRPSIKNKILVNDVLIEILEPGSLSEGFLKSELACSRFRT
jgi:hypothetical protein